MRSRFELSPRIYSREAVVAATEVFRDVCRVAFATRPSGAIELEITEIEPGDEREVRGEVMNFLLCRSLETARGAAER